jgi:hypothetical protein
VLDVELLARAERPWPGVGFQHHLAHLLDVDGRDGGSAVREDVFGVAPHEVRQRGHLARS